MKDIQLSRRDFLKIGLTLSSAAITNRLTNQVVRRKNVNVVQNTNPNIIIIVLDTLSALNMSLYGYQRDTTPNIDKFASQANVYHSHYATSNFTTPGTASILTGLYPWSHKASHYGGKIIRGQADHNIFKFIGNEYFKTAFAQNPWADILLWQFKDDINLLTDPAAFNLTNSTQYNRLFRKDKLIAYQGVEGFSLRQISGLPAAQIISAIREYRLNRQRKHYGEINKGQYPLGMPYIMNDSGDVYDLNTLFSGTRKLINDLTNPSLAYYHLYPPHGDYYGKYFPTSEFYNRYKNDGYQPQQKKGEIFPEQFSSDVIQDRLQNYDEFIASVDAQFGKLIQSLSKGILNSSYIILTSDHGELFERGKTGHTNDYLYQSLIKVPLIISCPGQKIGKDFYSLTSNVDLLPTIMKITGMSSPFFTDGQILPGFSNTIDINRSVFSMVSKSKPANGGKGPFTISIIKNKYKLIEYNGYDPNAVKHELFDLTKDPGELTDLHQTEREIFKTLQREMSIMAKKL